MIRLEPIQECRHAPYFAFDSKIRTFLVLSESEYMMLLTLSSQQMVMPTFLLRAFSELLICMLHQFGLGCIKNGAL